jgi:hypothetical protein
MTDACSKPLSKPKRSSVRWTSFVGTPARGRTVRGLEEENNPRHRVRVEHNRETLLVHISDEDGQGWTTVAIDRETREWSIAQRDRQLDAAQAAFDLLYPQKGAGPKQ